jgi:drug/metabolite transporter (DMT)-like permease
MPPALKSPQHSRAILMLLVANFFWGLSFPTIKALVLVQERLLPGAGTWFSGIYTVAPRFLLATLILLLLQARDWWQIRRGELKQGVIIGLFAAMGMLFQNDGLQFTAASTSAFLTQFYAIMIPVYLALRSRRNPRLTVWVSCALVLAGVAMLGRFNWRTMSLGRGEWETLLASVFFMGQILWLEKKEFVDNRPEKLTLVMFATEAVVFWALACILTPDTQALLTPWSSPAWLSLTATLTVFCTLGAFIIMNTWQPKITATEAGLIYCVEPIFGSAMALFLPGLFTVWAGINYPNETATLNLFIGGGLITAANILIQLNPPPHVPPYTSR